MVEKKSIILMVRSLGPDSQQCGLSRRHQRFMSEPVGMKRRRGQRGKLGSTLTKGGSDLLIQEFGFSLRVIRIHRKGLSRRSERGTISFLIQLRTSISKSLLFPWYGG